MICRCIFILYFFVIKVTASLVRFSLFIHYVVGWLVVLRINVDLAIFQPYLDLEAGDNQSLKIQVARPGIEPRSSCSASQELNHSATAAPYIHYATLFPDDTKVPKVVVECWIGCLTSQLTIFQSYMWQHIELQADWRKSWIYSRAPNAIDIS